MQIHEIGALARTIERLEKRLASTFLGWKPNTTTQVAVFTNGHRVAFDRVGRPRLLPR